MAAETTAGSRYGRLLVTLAPLIGLLLVIGVFALMSDAPDQYLSVRNLRIVLAQTVIVALGAIGMTMIIVSGGIDLSVGSAIALTGVVTAVLLRDGYGPFAAIAAGVAMGGLVGVLNGLAITMLRVLPFIATLGMLGVARGAGVVMVSSYLPELFGVCHSLAVMSRGRLTPARPIDEWTPESVMEAAIGG